MKCSLGDARLRPRVTRRNRPATPWPMRLTARSPAGDVCRPHHRGRGICRSKRPCLPRVSRTHRTQRGHVRRSRDSLCLSIARTALVLQHRHRSAWRRVSSFLRAGRLWRVELPRVSGVESLLAMWLGERSRQPHASVRYHCIRQRDVGIRWPPIHFDRTIDTQRIHRLGSASGCYSSTRSDPGGSRSRMTRQSLIIAAAHAPNRRTLAIPVVLRGHG